jgi:hypothetical protein
MTNLGNPKPNGTAHSGWRRDQLGDAFEGVPPPQDGAPLDAGPSPRDYQRPQIAQTAQNSPLRRSSARSVVSVGSVCHGITVSQRRAVFRLVRRLKGTRPDPPDEDELRGLRDSGSLLRSIPWDDFRLLVLEGWGKVRQSRGEGRLGDALAEADRRPLPRSAERYEQHQLRRLVGLCAVLQERAGNATFFVASNAVAEELDLSPTRVSRWLRLLVLDQVLIIVKRGHTGKATEYQYVGAVLR